MAIARSGPAGRLVVEPGDRVRATGTFVRMPDGVWLDLAQVNDLVGRPRPWKSSRSVRLRGAVVEEAMSSREAELALMAGRMQALGIWHGDVIDVETLTALGLPAHLPWAPLFVLPPPDGGWDASTQNTDVNGLEELRASGQIVREGWYRDDGDALLLRVAASDVADVERILGPQLPRRLCVVRSRYSADQLRDVEETFTAHAADWGFEMWSYQGMDAECQPHAEAALTRVCTELAVWADTLPDGLLSLQPVMTPA